jgi:membrane protein DedA with SNARE-associated domain
VTATISHLIESYGLVAVFVLMAGGACGLPIASEVLLPVAGVLVAAGHLGFAAVVVVAVLGNLVGSLVAYWIAARFGTQVLLGPGRWIGLSPHHLELATNWFQRYGRLAVFAGRMLPVVRSYVSFPAGLARQGLAAFVVLTTLGSLPWCAGLVAAGYFLGANYDRVSGPIQKATIVIAAVVVIAIAAWYVRGRSTGRSGERAR